MDLHLREEFLRQAQSLMVDNHHSEADELFDDVLSRTLFSFQTNRRISQGMIRFQGHERWQQIFEHILAESRFDLPDAEVDRYFERSFESVVEHLTRGPTSASSPSPTHPWSIGHACRTLTSPRASHRAGPRSTRWARDPGWALSVQPANK